MKFMEIIYHENKELSCSDPVLFASTTSLAATNGAKENHGTVGSSSIINPDR